MSTKEKHVLVSILSPDTHLDGFLYHSGFTLSWVERGEEAVRQAQQNAYDLLVLFTDYFFWGSEGIESLQDIIACVMAAREKLKGSPIIFLFSLQPPSDHERVLLAQSNIPCFHLPAGIADHEIALLTQSSISFFQLPMDIDALMTILQAPFEAKEQ